MGAKPRQLEETIHGDLSCLSLPARTRLLRLLERAELGVGELAEILRLPQPTVSNHLRQLMDRQWVERRREGNARLYQLSTKLSKRSRKLWELIRAERDHEHTEDLDRLTHVLAARSARGEDFFGKIAENWQALRRSLYGDQYILPTLLSLLPSDQVIADLGCGPGETLAALKTSGATLIGVDREPAMLRAAQRRLGEAPQIHLREGHLEALPLEDASLDAALLTLVLHLLPDPARALSELRRVLRPGGKAIILDMVEHERREYQRSMGHRQLGFSDQGLRDLLPAPLKLSSWRPLPATPGTKGPALFLALVTLPLEP